MPLLGRVVTTKLRVTCKRQLGKKKKKNFFLFLWAGKGWEVVEDWISEVY